METEACKQPNATHNGAAPCGGSAAHGTTTHCSTAPHGSSAPYNNSTSHCGTAPQVTVVVPLYNAATHVDQLVGCLQAQTLASFEAILVDDGSADATLDAAHTATVGDSRFSVLHQPNAGPGVARNAGLDIARGTYVAFVDADDTVDTHYLESLYTRVQEAAADIAICQMTHRYPDGNEVKSPDAWPAEQLPAVFAPADLADTLFGTFRNWPVDKLFRRAFLDEHNIRFPALRRTEDLAFTCAALASAGRIALVDEALYTYHMYTSTSSTASRDTAPLDFFESCLHLRHYLERHNLLATFANTYQQWVSLCCMLNVVELNTRAGFDAAYDVLHEGGLEQLGICTPRTYLRTHPTAIAAGHTPNSEVDAILSIVEENARAAGLRKLLARGHCAQVVKPAWLKGFSFSHPLRSLHALLTRT